MSAHVADLDLLRDDLIIDLRVERAAPDRGLVTTLGLDLTLPSDAYVRYVKPAFDRLVAALLLLALLPLLLAATAAVRWSLGRGVLYRQERVGLGGRHFTVYKLRTMLPDRRAERTGSWDGIDRRVAHKTLADPRHTRVGQFLRKWSLDELPQLVNVLRGEMSLVGPRPELPHIVERYQPWEHARHAVRPGLTGFWQTRARRDGPMHDFTYLDLDYVRSVSPATDLKVLAQTLPAMLGSQRGS